MTKIRVKKINALAFLSFILAHAYAEEVSSEIISTSTLKKVGYTTTKYVRYNATICARYGDDRYEGDWYKGNLEAIKNYQGIKTIHPVTNNEPVYTRFTIIKEAYKTQDMAVQRLAQVSQPFNFKTNSWYSKKCSIKKGCHIGSDVYFVATDVGMFRNSISGFIIHLKQMLKAND